MPTSDARWEEAVDVLEEEVQRYQERGDADDEPDGVVANPSAEGVREQGDRGQRRTPQRDLRDGLVVVEPAAGEGVFGRGSRIAG